MYPDVDYASSRGSFERPVVPPTSDPTDSPTISVPINCQWLPYIRGALQQLLLQATWSTDSAGLLLAQERVFKLIDLFQECSPAVLPFACPYDFSVGDGGWSILIDPSFTPATMGFYVAASEFQGSHVVNNATTSPWGILGIEKSLGGTFNCTSMDMTFDLTKGTFSGSTNGFVAGFLAGALKFVQYMDCSARPDGNGQHLVWSGASTPVDFLQCYIVSEVYPAGAGIPGFCAISNVELTGIGTPPC